MPAGDTELEIIFRGGDNFYVTPSPEGSLYIYVEEDDDESLPLDYATMRIFETGENVEGYYLGTVLEGKSAKHVYWVNWVSGNIRRTRK